VEAPLAVSVALLPAQTVAPGTEIVGEAVTVIVRFFVEMHPPVLPVTVYVVVTEGARV
jgi:uncharacterized membrane protein (DUF106 family)